MRWYTKLVLLLLVVALVLPFWLRAPDVRPILSVGDWPRPPSLESVFDGVRDVLKPLAEGDGRDDEGQAQEPAAGSYYSWRDEAGVWHFSDQPPQQPLEHLRPQPLPVPANRIGAPSASPYRADSGPGGGNSTDIDSSIGVPLPAGVSREAIETLLEEAHEKRMGDQRQPPTEQLE
jgi:hypothetical protein